MFFFSSSSPSSWQKPYSSSPPTAPPSKGFHTRPKVVFTGSFSAFVLPVQSWVWQPSHTTSTWTVNPTSPRGTVCWACLRSAWLGYSLWQQCLSSITLWPKAGPWPSSNVTTRRLDSSPTCLAASACSSASAPPGSLLLSWSTPGTCQYSAPPSAPSS